MHLRAHNDTRRVITDPRAPYFGVVLDDHTLVPATAATVFPPTTPIGSPPASPLRSPDPPHLEEFAHDDIRTDTAAQRVCP